MKNLNAAAAVATLLVIAGPASADFRNGPNPYDLGFGFDEPDEASATWGGWTRGDAGTIHVEFDSFAETEFGSRLATPDIAAFGADAEIAWNQNTFVTGSQNLYSFSVAPDFDLTLDTDLDFTGETTVALQLETWGTPLDVSSVLLNGVTAGVTATTYTDSEYDSPFGLVLLEHLLFVWTFDSPTDFVFDFTASGSSLSLTQVAIDIASAPAVVPVPAAAWLLGSGLLGLVGMRRRRQLAA